MFYIGGKLFKVGEIVSYIY